MDKRPHQIVWSKTADKQLFEAFKYIAKDSLQNAQKVVLDIQSSVERISKNPEIRPVDKYKRNNNGSYRCFVKHHYRISYRIGENYTIIIIRLRHTKQKVRFY